MNTSKSSLPFRLLARILALTAGAALISAPSARAGNNLVANGSFEQPPNQPNRNGDDSLTPYGPGYLVGNSGWQVTQNAVELIRHYFVPTDGLQTIDMDEGALPDNRGVISQTIATVAGTTYDFSFDMAGNFQGNPEFGGTADPIKRLGVSWDGLTFAHLTFDSTGKNNSSLAAMGWVHYDFLVTATSGTSEIGFASETLDPHSAFGAVLDNVSLEAVPDNASTGAMFLLSVVGLCSFGSRARRTVNA